MEEITVRLPVIAHYNGEETTYEYADIPIEAFMEWCSKCNDELELRGSKPISAYGKD